MRLLFVTGEFPPMQGGVGDYTREIATGLAGDHAVCVLTSRRAGGSEQPWVRPLVSRWDWASLRTIRGVVRDFAPDVIDIQYQTGAYAMHPAINFLPRLLKRFPGRTPRPRVVITFHDLRIPYLFPKAGRARDWVTRELARYADAVIATNTQDAARLAAWNIANVCIIPIGSNISTREPIDYDRAAWRTRLGIDADEVLLCHFGFVNSRKGCDTLVKALAKLPRAKLLMIGGETGASDPTNTAYLAQLQALIGELGLGSRVLWTGYTPPDIVTANFRAADVCILPYREGASYRHGTLMAALAHGMPIVTTRPSGPAAEPSSLPALADGDNCLLVPPDDPIALVNAINRALASPQLLALIGQGALQLAAHFAWDTIVEQHLALYTRLRPARLGV